MARTVVWAFRAIQELNGETGLVECEEELARKLIDKGLAQDPSVGALAFKEIEVAPAKASPADDVQHKHLDAHSYQTTELPHEEQHTTDLTPPKGRKTRR